MEMSVRSEIVVATKILSEAVAILILLSFAVDTACAMQKYASPQFIQGGRPQMRGRAFGGALFDPYAGGGPPPPGMRSPKSNPTERSLERRSFERHIPK
jgi:hypothetical protein